MEKTVVVKELGKFIPGTQDMTSFELKEIKTNDLVYTFNAVRNYLKDFSMESEEHTIAFKAYLTLVDEIVRRRIVKVLTNDSYILDTY